MAVLGGVGTCVWTAVECAAREGEEMSRKTRAVFYCMLGNKWEEEKNIHDVMCNTVIRAVEKRIRGTLMAHG